MNLLILGGTSFRGPADFDFGAKPGAPEIQCAREAGFIAAWKAHTKK
ncbi:MAG: hypothetical protein O2875_05500 [Planctomycetota bacterium]|nr:hypothetical protein [Planctomycetota bacterium]MDA1262908.1 hypothetical protein [Planctomycetota bacterium]